MARVPRVFADSSESKGGMGAEGSLAAHLRVLVCMKVGGFVPYHPYHTSTSSDSRIAVLKL